MRRVSAKVLSGSPGDAAFEALRDAVFDAPGLDRVLAHVGAGGSPPELSGLVESRDAPGHPATAWVCENFVCRPPVSDPSALRALLDAG